MVIKVPHQLHLRAAVDNTPAPPQAAPATLHPRSLSATGLRWKALLRRARGAHFCQSAQPVASAGGGAFRTAVERSGAARRRDRGSRK